MTANNKTANNKKKRPVVTIQHIAWGLTALIVICLSIAFYLVLTKMPSFRAGLSKLLDVLMPIILGSVMAYLLLPVYNWLYRTFGSWLSRTRISENTGVKLSKGFSAGLSLLLLIVVVVGLLLMAGPQVLQSIMDVARSVPSNVDKFSIWVEKFLKDYPEILGIANNIIDSFETSLMDIITNYIMPSVNTLIAGITVGVINALSFMFDLIIGFIVCIYVLSSKETFAAQAKKLVYSLFDAEKANAVISETRSIHRIFSGFISGKLIDSLIIGMITFVALSFMNMPYTVMISVVVGVTNVIPFFGPFIGAIPSAIIIFTVDPLKSLYFVIYIIIIQQIDGNIIGPKILGNTTGLPSFWVLFSILVGGGLFGFAGMLLGVPVFATICMFMSQYVERKLEQRGLPADTEDYRQMKDIDPQSRKFNMFEQDFRFGAAVGAHEESGESGERSESKASEKSENGENGEEMPDGTHDNAAE